MRWRWRRKSFSGSVIESERSTITLTRRHYQNSETRESRTKMNVSITNTFHWAQVVADEMIEIFSDWKLTDESKHCFYHSIKANCWKEFRKWDSTTTAMRVNFSAFFITSRRAALMNKSTRNAERQRPRRKTREWKIREMYKKPQTHCN